MACEAGAAEFGSMVKQLEAKSHALAWEDVRSEVQRLYIADSTLKSMTFLICTEPFAVCLMLRDLAALNGRLVPLLGYLGVALLQGCPLIGLERFWHGLS